MKAAAPGAAILCGMLFAAAAAAAAGQPAIGRLFSPAPDGRAGTPGLTLPDSRQRVDGAVIRSSKRNTVWIDGVAFPQAGSEGRGAVPGGEEAALRILPPRRGKADLAPPEVAARGRDP